MSTPEANTGTKPVAEQHAFDVPALEAYLVARLPGFAGPLTVEQFKGGQSNPTYKLQTPGRAYVMRSQPGPVAKLLAMDRTTLTAALKPLEKRGLVRIETDPEDRRSRLLALTNAGRAVLANSVPIWRATHAEVEAVLPPPGADGLRGALAALA